MGAAGACSSGSALSAPTVPPWHSTTTSAVCSGVRFTSGRGIATSFLRGWGVVLAPHVAARSADELDDHPVRVAQEQNRHAAEPGAWQLDELGGLQRSVGGQGYVGRVHVVDPERDPVEPAVVGGRRGATGPLPVLPPGELERDRWVP